MKNKMDEQPSIHAVKEATYGGYLFRMEYEEMEEHRQHPKGRLKAVVFGIGFCAVVILVTMALIAAGTSIF